ncbi:hypothetical protein EBR96_06955, partial [bacterium]|nr:hypothetical protein [bacterium]
QALAGSPIGVSVAVDLANAGETGAAEILRASAAPAAADNPIGVALDGIAASGGRAVSAEATKALLDHLKGTDKPNPAATEVLLNTVIGRAAAPNTAAISDVLRQLSTELDSGGLEGAVFKALSKPGIDGSTPVLKRLIDALGPDEHSPALRSVQAKLVQIMASRTESSQMIATAATIMPMLSPEQQDSAARTVVDTISKETGTPAMAADRMVDLLSDPKRPVSSEVSQKLIATFIDGNDNRAAELIQTVQAVTDGVSLQMVMKGIKDAKIPMTYGSAVFTALSDITNRALKNGQFDVLIGSNGQPGLVHTLDGEVVGKLLVTNVWERNLNSNPFQVSDNFNTELNKMMSSRAVSSRVGDPEVAKMLGQCISQQGLQSLRHSNSWLRTLISESGRFTKEDLRREIDAQTGKEGSINDAQLDQLMNALEPKLTPEPTPNPKLATIKRTDTNPHYMLPDGDFGSVVDGAGLADPALVGAAKAALKQIGQRQADMVRQLSPDAKAILLATTNDDVHQSSWAGIGSGMLRGLADGVRAFTLPGPSALLVPRLGDPKTTTGRYAMTDADKQLLAQSLGTEPIGSTSTMKHREWITNWMDNVPHNYVRRNVMTGIGKPYTAHPITAMEMKTGVDAAVASMDDGHVPTIDDLSFACVPFGLRQTPGAAPADITTKLIGAAHNADDTGPVASQAMRGAFFANGLSDLPLEPGLAGPAEELGFSPERMTDARAKLMDLITTTPHSGGSINASAILREMAKAGFGVADTLVAAGGLESSHPSLAGMNIRDRIRDVEMDQLIEASMTAAVHPSRADLPTDF